MSKREQGFWRREPCPYAAGTVGNGGAAPARGAVPRPSAARGRGMAGLGPGSLGSGTALRIALALTGLTLLGSACKEEGGGSEPPANGPKVEIPEGDCEVGEGEDAPDFLQAI